MWVFAMLLQPLIFLIYNVLQLPLFKNYNIALERKLNIEVSIIKTIHPGIECNAIIPTLARLNKIRSSRSD